MYGDLEIGQNNALFPTYLRRVEHHRSIPDGDDAGTVSRADRYVLSIRIGIRQAYPPFACQNQAEDLEEAYFCVADGNKVIYG